MSGGITVDLFLFSFAHHAICICQKKFETFSMTHIYTLAFRKNTLRVVIVLPERYLQEKLNLNYFVQQNYKGNREVDGLFISIVSFLVFISNMKLRENFRPFPNVALRIASLCRTDRTIGCQKVCCVTNNCLYANFSKLLKLCFGTHSARTK